MEKIKNLIKKRKQKKAQKKLKKRRSKFLYKVKHQKSTPNKILYGIELFFAALLDFIFFVLNFILGIIVFLLILFLIFSLLVGYVARTYIDPKYKVYVQLANEIVEESSPDDFQIKEGSIIYDSEKNVLANLYDTSFCTYLDYAEIPQDVIDGFVAIEDRTFWENDGVDYLGIARVLYNFLQTKGEEAHGASTITQQLVRTVYLTRDVSLERKAKEILVSWGLTEKYSKNEIMEYYINTCCFANGIYGIQGASKAYFGKDAADLTLAQCAYLCAIPNRPSYYDPKVDSKRAIPRQKKILKDMYACGYITKSEYKKALKEKIKIVDTEFVYNDYASTYAIDCAVRYLMKLDKYDFKYKFDSMEEYTAYHDKYAEDYAVYKDKLYTGGYRIYTSLDMSVYDKVQQVVDDTLESYNNDIDDDTGIFLLQGALTVIDNKTHKVIAVVGGRSQERDNKVYSFNRAYQSFRQPGSSIKPIIVYTPAIIKGYTANTKVYNIDVSKAKEKDVDVQQLTGDEMLLRSAVEQSKNGVAWQIFDKITPKVGLSYATKMKFSNLCPNDYFDSAALGGLTYGVNTVEMASAYETLANHGYYYEPTCISAFYDSDGVNLYVKEKEISVYKPQAADEMVDICEGVLTVGTAKAQGWSKSTDMAAFGKTGTTNSNKDVWFCGATPYYSIAVWVGYDTPKAMNGVYGASYPATIWKNSMLSLIDGLEIKKFEPLIEKKEDDNKEEKVTGDGSKYLEGRDDSEVLSSGYTVADYRSDRLIGEQIQAVIDEMNSLNKSSPNFKSNLDTLYSQGQGYVDTIYSQKYTAEMRLKLQTTYENLGGASKYSGSNSNAKTEYKPQETKQEETKSDSSNEDNSKKEESKKENKDQPKEDKKETSEDLTEENNEIINEVVDEETNTEDNELEAD